jgi:hypothetical protein
MDGRIWGVARRHFRSGRLSNESVPPPRPPHFGAPSFLSRDRTMTSDAESVCCVSGEGIDMECVLWHQSWSPTTSISHGRKENGENEKTTKNEMRNEQ